MAGMVFLVLVVLTATQAGIALSLYMAALCAVTFEFFFLPPYQTFSLAGTEQWIAMLAFVASCLVVSRVAERARRQTEEARQRQADVERLYAMSQEMMLHGDAEGLIRDLPRLVGKSSRSTMWRFWFATGTVLTSHLERYRRAWRQACGPFHKGSSCRLN